MSQMLFRTDKKHTVVIDEDAIDLEPNLKKIDAKSKLYLILGWDYFSPYARLSKEERIGRAKRQVYGKDGIAPDGEKKFTDAIESYMALQYDYRREFRDSNLLRAKELQDEMIVERDMNKIPKLQVAINVFLENAKRYQSEIDQIDADEQDNLKGGATISHIEKWQNKQREFRKNKQKKLA